MRRPLLVLFVLLLVMSFIYTSNKSLDDIEDKEKITIEAVIKDKIEKE